MAITQPSPSSPLLLGLGGGGQSLNPTASAAAAPVAPMQGGGFHFHFNGSLQAYQEARAGAGAGTVLPPTGESLPDAPDIESEQPDGTVDPELGQQGLLLETASEAAEQLPTEKLQAQAAQTQAEAADKSAQTMANGEALAARQQTGAARQVEAERQGDQRRQAEAVHVERNVEQLTREQKTAEQSAQMQLRDQQVAAEAARQQQAGQQNREQQIQQQAAQTQQQTAQSQQAASADQQRAAMRSEGQPASRAETVRQSESVRQNEAAGTVRATPAQPFPGEGKPAQPAIPASVTREQAQATGAMVGVEGGVEAAPGVNTDTDSLRLTEAGQPAAGVQPDGDPSVQGQPLVSSESTADETRQPINLQPQNGPAQSAISATASTQSDGALEAAVTANNAPRTGPDTAGGRVQVEAMASRADQVVQGGSGSNMSDEGGGEQPSQRQDSQQAQAQAAAGNRSQSAAPGVALPQQPFSLAQQQLLSPNWGQAMGERAIMMAQHGPRTAQIQLDPPELGAMQIRIHMQGGDQVSVSFTSPNPMVREALEQQMPRLREMFAEQGLNLQDSSVADQSSQQQSGQHEQARQGQPGGSYGQGDAVPNEGLALHSVKVGLVDYYA
ncbi:flagellar hook-length control protein FliK [Marinobacterium sp. MBR-109]|jgi:flagellar hook-length control protein FliK|uniref:flagellar hook-length control protein FliK n=1 Tax=Marinobacterium sp. MBR-109 TaxID=3156462 RepID=UPI003391DB0A